ncbi:MAG: DNA topoisomerase I [candidate division KSB1 bacterium]|nr:DNA topoisomerase I [candidate division KSB1 bacterium]
MKELIHNGVVVPEPPPYRGLKLKIRGVERTLDPKQEEMAIAWARKQGTPYVEDPVFVRNFLEDFSTALGIEPPLRPGEVDFGPAVKIVEEERQAKLAMSKEERKALAAERKAKREALKERYGYAVVDGERVELGTYLAEPSCIFMGRGKHPLRGRWKEGPQQSDITLNLSPNAPRPAGHWQEIVWEPDSLWVARWKDKLSGKMKYIWLHDTAPVKQAREASKFDKAHELDAELERVRRQIAQDLTSPEPRRREVATACYLIDALCMRVGDEKDPDEADTVGATTLRPEHVKLHQGGVAEFRFLGKDSVLWHKKLTLPPEVVANLQELIRNARPSNNRNRKKHPMHEKPQLFPGISSRHVNEYLSSILPGLTAKVFRTHHATRAVRHSLEHSGVSADDPEYKKWQAAALANLEAAILCNHTKKAPANWNERREKLKERQRKAEERVEKCQMEVQKLQASLSALKKEAREKTKAAPATKKANVKERYAKAVARTEAKLAAAQRRLENAEYALGALKARITIATKNRTWNLGTSLKSYIEPRVYYHWGRRVGYDVLDRYYPKTLARKFAWVREEEEED